MAEPDTLIRRGPYAAGLLAWAGDRLPPEQLQAALDRAPWRGRVTDRHITPYGGIVALGSATIHRHRHIAIAIHGRIDNLAALARAVDASPDDEGAVLASAYLRFGDEFARQLIGDFAIVLLDDHRQVVVGARDWIGARPLFWGAHGGVTAFGSEVKQVLALLGRPFVIDEDVLGRYERAYDAMPLDATFAAGVTAVLPSGQVVIRDGEGARAWRCPVRFEPIEIAMPEAVAETRRLLEQAVARRTAGAASLGAKVSGGMDSTSVAATAAYLAANRGGPPVRHAYTLSYPGFPKCDETALARLVAERWHMCAVPIDVDPAGLAPHYPAEIALHDGPPFPSVGQSLLACRAAMCGTDVLLTGQTADGFLEQWGHEIVLSLLRGHWRDVALWTMFYARRPRAGAGAWRHAVRQWQRGERAERVFERRLEEAMGRIPLELEEREAMQAGMRLEAPFADEELARFLAGLPSSVRSDPRRRFTKAVLREAMDGLLPPEVRLRRDKPGFENVVAVALGAGEGASHTLAFEVYAEAFRASHGGPDASRSEEDPMALSASASRVS